jgi:hypothetical protein
MKAAALVCNWDEMSTCSYEQNISNSYNKKCINPLKPSDNFALPVIELLSSCP